MISAANHPKTVRAVVSRGGRPDLAAAALEHVRVPVLLIVGERDEVVIDLNRRALANLAAPAGISSFLARRICSKSRVRWTRSSSWRSAGSSVTPRGREAYHAADHVQALSRSSRRREGAAGHLVGTPDRPDVIVLALPRGGVPVGYEVAQALGARLDVFIVRKLGVPGHEEYTMGAVASGGVRVLNDDAMRSLRLSDETVDRVTARELDELKRRERLYRGNRPEPDLNARTVILVDDGLATGSTMKAAVKALARRVPPGSRSRCPSPRRIPARRFVVKWMKWCVP